MRNDCSEAKAALRKVAFSARRQAHATQSAAPEAVRNHFLAAGLHRASKIAAGYRPIQTEIEPTPLMIALIENGLRLSVPVIQGAGQPLLFREWTPGTRMEAGIFGAEIPAEGDWLEPDLVLVPLVAFDAGGARLGYGGGYYDRTLELLRKRKPVRAIGIAYAAQHVDRVPVDASDQRLDMVITEEGILQPVNEDTA